MNILRREVHLDEHHKNYFSFQRYRCSTTQSVYWNRIANAETFRIEVSFPVPISLNLTEVNSFQFACVNQLACFCVSQNFLVATANFQANRQALWKVEQSFPEKHQIYRSAID